MVGRVLPRPKSLRAILLLAGLTLPQAACDQARPWQRADWRPTAPPQRVVVGSVLAAESLLGVLPRERIAGAHLFAADPAYCLVAERARGLRLLGATTEELLSVQPDLVIVDAFTRAETLALLGAADVPVVRTIDSHDVDDIEHNLRLLGRVTHCEDELAETIRTMRAAIDGVRRGGEDLASWRLLSLDGALHTYGEGSLFDVVARIAGARNVAAEHGVGAFRKLDIEEVLAWRPDAIVLSAASLPTGGDPGEQPIPEWMQQCPGIDRLRCVQQGRLIFVPGPLLSTTSHHLVEASAFVQRQLRAWGKP